MIGRALVTLGALLAWASLGRVLRVEGMPHAPWGLDALPINAAVATVVSLVFAASCMAFVIRRWEDAAAGVMVVMLAAGTQVMAWQWPPGMGVNGATMLPGAALTAWWVARRVGGAIGREDRGIEAACGLVAACYFVAMSSKVATSGLGWASAGNIGLQIATQGYLGEPLQSLRLAAAHSPILCSALGVGTLLIKGGALLFVVPGARGCVVALLIGMHLGISVLMGLHHYDWMFTAVGWAAMSGTRRAQA